LSRDEDGDGISMREVDLGLKKFMKRKSIKTFMEIWGEEEIEKAIGIIEIDEEENISMKRRGRKEKIEETTLFNGEKGEIETFMDARKDERAEMEERRRGRRKDLTRRRAVKRTRRRREDERRERREIKTTLGAKIEENMEKRSGGKKMRRRRSRWKEN
jgi:hypothetical protein